MAGGNSKDRRRERRELQRQSRSTLVYWSFAAAMAIIIVFVKRTPGWTLLLLSALWVFLVILALNLKSVRAGNAGISRFLNRSSAILGVSVAVVIFGVYNWPVASKGLGELTAKERDAFVAELRTQSEPILVHLMCPPNDER